MSLKSHLLAPRSLAACATVLLAALTTLNAQSVTTTPVGALTTSAAPNADTHLTVTLGRPEIYTGTITSVAGNTITLEGANFTSNALQYNASTQSNTYHIQIQSGAKSGHYSTIIANTATSVTCEFEPDIISGLAAGNKVIIRPYWTLATLFPATQAGTSFIASTSNFASGRRTEILFPNLTGTGVNRAPNATYFFNSYWRLVGNTTDSRNDTIILPDSYLIIRGNNYSNTLTLTYTGVVNTSPNTVALLSLTSGYNDNPIGLPLPTDTTLQSLNLVGDGKPFTVSTSNFTSGRGDELLVYDNATQVKNKAPSSTYFYNGFWRKVGQTSVDSSATIIPAGAAVLIRKKPTALASVTDWTIPSAIQ